MKIKLLVMDVDGTLTDGKIYIGPDGEVMKAFNVKDGMRIKRLANERGTVSAIITGRTSKITENRAKEMRIKEVIQGTSNKLPALMALVEKYGVTLEETAYIGDDFIDIPCLEACGFSGCPADSAPEVIAVSKYVCKLKGGEGAVGEFADWLREISE